MPGRELLDASRRVVAVRLVLSPRRPPSSTVFPYTTLFRSARGFRGDAFFGRRGGGADELGQALARVVAIACLVAKAADRKSTRLNSSHVAISYAVFCLKKKKCNSASQEARARRMCRAAGPH